MNDTALKSRFKVDGMDCAACAARIEGAVKRLDGVEDVSISVMTGAMTVHHGTTADLEAVGDSLGELPELGLVSFIGDGTRPAREFTRYRCWERVRRWGHHVGQ